VRSLVSRFVEPISYVGGDVGLDYHAADYLLVGGGIRGAWQEQDTLGALWTALVFLQLTLIAPTQRF
jgi:hypothetical protein